MNAFTITPIGIVHSPFTASAGTPIQPRFAAGACGSVEVFAQYADALKDLDGFERIWLVYWFDRASQAKLTVKPFLDTVERGLFATRAPCRPNPIGISPVRLVGIDGCVLRVEDVDLLDGTPLVDIKPYAPRFDSFEVTRCGWLDETPEGHRTIADDRFDSDRQR